MKKKLISVLMGCLLAQTVCAATQINLSQQAMTFKQNLLNALSADSTASHARQFFCMSSLPFTQEPLQLRTIQSNTDFNQVTHLHFQQWYHNLPVWGATGIVHKKRVTKINNLTVPSLDMEGIIYADLANDLDEKVFAQMNTPDQQAKALAQVKHTLNYSSSWQLKSIQPIVYIDHQKAHYAYLIYFDQDDHLTGAHRPSFIMDAATFSVYRQWDQILHTLPVVLAGGIGGNEKTGPLYYDSGPGHLSALLMEYLYEEIHSVGHTLYVCHLQNSLIRIEDTAYASEVPQVACAKDKGQHADVAWFNERAWENEDAINGGYSPTLDAFYAATIVQAFYQNWYGIPALSQDNQPMPIVLRVHYGRHYENAYWDGEKITLGDGGDNFYPLTSLDVIAHEMSHGFTEQHANLDASSLEMAGLHESFSDMAAVSIQFYVTGQLKWNIGSTVIKQEGAIRYLDEPTKDSMSIDNAADLNKPGLESHEVAGIFNKAFYLIATSPGWSIRKAFNIMVKANTDYWMESMRYLQEAACGVVEATEDYAQIDSSYDLATVKRAFEKVGLDKMERCSVAKS